MPVDINPQFAVGPVTECHLACQNGGYCTNISADERTTLEIFSGGHMIDHCICPPGYSGLTCENVVEQCHDLKCHNGAPCSFKNGQYLCDCSEADAISRFAGAMCRDPATSYCGQGGIHNRGFCTNGGLCKANLSLDSSALLGNDYAINDGCHCPPEFEGPHCEFLKGRVLSPSKNQQEEVALKTPSDNAIAPQTPTINGLKAKEIMTPLLSTQNASTPTEATGVFPAVGIFVGIAMFVFGVAIMAQHRRRSRKDRVRRDMLDRESYRDETPIRVRIMGELEGLESGGDRYFDDEDLGSVSECSLEEIELEDDPVADNFREYFQQTRVGDNGTYFGNTPDFMNIIGPLVNRQQQQRSGADE